MFSLDLFTFCFMVFVFSFSFNYFFNFVNAALERKMSMRAHRDELIQKGILLPDLANSTNTSNTLSTIAGKVQTKSNKNRGKKMEYILFLLSQVQSCIVFRTLPILRISLQVSRLQQLTSGRCLTCHSFFCSLSPQIVISFFFFFFLLLLPPPPPISMFFLAGGRW